MQARAEISCLASRALATLARIMLRSLLLLAAASLPVTSFATVAFDIGAQRLDNATGTPMPANGLVLLVADRDRDGFLAPSTTWFTEGDDLLVNAWPNAVENTPFAFGPGIFLGGASTELGSGLDAGDPVKLIWFPTLTTTNSAPTFGTPFGAYTNATWVVPSDGFSANLSFQTFDQGGSDPLVTGDATLTVVPEPSAYAAIAALGCMSWAMIRRRAHRA